MIPAGVSCISKLQSQHSSWQFVKVTVTTSWLPRRSGRQMSVNNERKPEEGCELPACTWAEWFWASWLLSVCVCVCVWMFGGGKKSWFGQWRIPDHQSPAIMTNLPRSASWQTHHYHFSCQHLVKIPSERERERTLLFRHYCSFPGLHHDHRHFWQASDISLT